MAIKSLKPQRNDVVYIRKPAEVYSIPKLFAGSIILTGGTEADPINFWLHAGAVHIVRKGANVILHGRGRVRVEGGHIEAYGRDMHITATHDSRVRAYGRVKVKACGRAVVCAGGRTHIRATADSTVELKDRAVCEAKSRAVIHAKGRTHCVIQDDVQIFPEKDASWRHKSWKANVRGNPYRIEEEE